MRSNRTLSRTVALCLMLLALSAPVHAEVLLTADFEGNPTELPPLWTNLFGGAVWGTEVLITEEHAFSGSRSIKIVDTRSDRGIGLRTQLLAIDDAGPYRATVHMRNDETGWGTVYLEFWNERGIRIDHHIVSANTRGVWERVTVEAAAPEEATHVTVLLYSSGPSVGSTYFDTVTLERVERSAEAPAGEYTVTRRPLDPDAIVSLGSPIEWQQMGSAALGWDKEGNPTWYYTSPGASTGRLYAVRIKDGELLGEYPYPGGGQNWAVVAMENGDVYFSAGATLLKLDAELGEVRSLGRPYPNTGMIWDLELGPDGVLYGATYPEARLFRLDPADDRFFDLGRVSSEEYARSLGVSERHLFVGIGPVTDLIAYDKETGDVRSLLPERYRGQQGFITQVDVRGNRVFVLLPGNATLVFDANTLEVVGELAGVHWPISPVDEDGFVYFRLHSAPYRYHLETDRFGQHGLVQPEAAALGFAALEPDLVPEARRSRFQGPNLVGIQRGQYWAKNQETHQLLMVPTEIEPTPIRINSMGAQGDVIYGGGITPGGLFLFNAQTGENTVAPPVGQTDSLALHNGKLYFGTYTGANVRVYDVATGEVRTLGTVGHQQDRPVAMLAHEGRVYVGTVPEYGIWGGALAVVEPSGGIRTFRDVVPNHSIVALAGDHGVIYGGTSTLGGLGKDRAPGDGALFAWSTGSQSVLWTEYPLANEPAIGALIVGPNGLIWGVGTHSIFAFDPASRSVVWQEQLKSIGSAAYTWREAFATTYGEYVLLTLNREYLAIVNTAEKTVRVVPGDYDRIAVDSEGNLYFNRVSELFKVPKAAWSAGR